MRTQSLTSLLLLFFISQIQLFRTISTWLIKFIIVRLHFRKSPKHKRERKICRSPKNKKLISYEKFTAKIILFIFNSSFSFFPIVFILSVFSQKIFKRKMEGKFFSWWKLFLLKLNVFFNFFIYVIFISQDIFQFYFLLFLVRKERKKPWRKFIRIYLDNVGNYFWFILLGGLLWWIYGSFYVISRMTLNDLFDNFFATIRKRQMKPWWICFLMKNIPPGKFMKFCLKNINPRSVLIISPKQEPSVKNHLKNFRPKKIMC